MPRGVVTVGAITCGLRFARKVQVNSVIDSIYYFSVEEIHSMAVLGIFIATHQLQSTKRLPVKYVATGLLLYHADAPIQPYFIDVGMSNPVPLQPHCTAWACDNCAPPLLLSCLLQSPPQLCSPGRALHHPHLFNCTALTLPCMFRVIVSGSYGASVATCKSL